MICSATEADDVAASKSTSRSISSLNVAMMFFNSLADREGVESPFVFARCRFDGLVDIAVPCEPRDDKQKSRGQAIEC